MFVGKVINLLKVIIKKLTLVDSHIFRIPFPVVRDISSY